MNGLDALKMRCPLFSRKQTCIRRRPKVGFSDLIPNFLRMNGRFAPKAALGRLEIQLPLYHRKQTQLGNRGTSEKCTTGLMHCSKAPSLEDNVSSLQKGLRYL